MKSLSYIKKVHIIKFCFALNVCKVHEKLRASESQNGASFIALFGPALSLGIISRRRVHYEAIKYEKERNAGFLSPFGYSAATIAAAVEAVFSKEVITITVMLCYEYKLIRVLLVWFCLISYTWAVSLIFVFCSLFYQRS